MLLRYNINTFWSNSISTSRLKYIKQRFNNFFELILKNNFLLPLKIQYKEKNIHLYVFFFKEERFSFLRKFLILKKINLNQLILRKKYNLSGTLKTLIKKKLIYNRILTILNLKYGISYLLCLNVKNIVVNLNVEKLFFLLKNQKKILAKKLRKKRKKKIKRKFLKKFKLKFLNYIIKFKWLGLFLHIILNFYTYENYKISVKSALEKKISLLKTPYLFKYLRLESLKQKLYIIIISLTFLKSSILNTYINWIVKKTKNKKHVRNICIFFHTLKYFFDKQIIPFAGLKFAISGRLSGKLRKSSFGYKLGTMQLMNFSLYIDYSCDYVFTQYGSLSLKLWLCGNSTKLN